MALKVLGDVDSHIETETTESAVSAFLAYCQRNNKPRTVRDYTRLLNKHFPSGKMGNLSRLGITKKLNTLTHVPSELFHTTAVFQTFLNWCVNNGRIESNPIAGLKNQGKVNQRDRVLNDDELKAVWGALGNDRFSTIIRLMILTGQRRGEIPHLLLENDVITLPKEHAKNNRAHSFPIGTFSLQYFQSVKYNGWSKAKVQLDKDCGVTDWTFHDLRRTFATNHARLGTPIHVVEKMLNHVSGSFSGIVSVYQNINSWTKCARLATGKCVFG